MAENKPRSTKKWQDTCRGYHDGHRYYKDTWPIHMLARSGKLAIKNLHDWYDHNTPLLWNQWQWW